MGSLTRTRNTRLGLNMIGAANGKAALGFAIVERERPKAASKREFGDVLELARREAQKQKSEERALVLFSYLNDSAFEGSQGAKDGLLRQHHVEMIEFVAAQLVCDGFDIIICEID